MDKVTKVNKTVYDKVTGEIISDKTYEYHAKKLIKFKGDDAFTKVFVNASPILSKEAFYSYFYKLIHIIQKHTNVLVLRKFKEDGSGREKKISTATAPMLADYLNISLQHFRRFLTDAKKKGAIAGLHTSEGYGYVINPAYAYNGAGINAILFSIFDKDEVFVHNLSKEHLNDYKKITGNDYMLNIKDNFPKLYMKMQGEVK